MRRRQSFGNSSSSIRRFSVAPCVKKNVGIGENYYQTLQQVRGKYLAICDGDDLWIDDHKLQKEVDFLERHSDFNVVCTSFQKRELKRMERLKILCLTWTITFSCPGPKKESYGLKDLLHIRFVASCTAMLRWQFRGGFVPDFLRNYKTIDFPLALMHAACGKIGCWERSDRALSCARRRYYIAAGIQYASRGHADSAGNRSIFGLSFRGGTCSGNRGRQRDFF